MKFLNAGARLNLARFRRKLLASVQEQDPERTGKVTTTELFTGLAEANIGMSEHEFDQLARMLEKSGDGLVDISLLVAVLDQLSTEYRASIDAQFMPGGELLAFSVAAPKSKDAIAQGVWPVAGSPPGVQRERRAGIVTPWAERVAVSLKGMTATQASQRKWRKHEEPTDYRWPALPVQPKSPKPYQMPRSASPRARPWPQRVDAVASVRQRKSSRLQQHPAPQRDHDHPLSRSEAGKVARAQLLAKRTAREVVSVAREKQLSQTARAVSPYTMTPSARLTKELLSKGQRRPHTAGASIGARPRSSGSSAEIDSTLQPSANGAGHWSPRLASPIGIYLPSSCGPSPPIDVPPVGSRRRAYPRRAATRNDLPPAARTVSLAMPQSSSEQLEDDVG
jgi:hypothetical protein